MLTTDLMKHTFMNTTSHIINTNFSELSNDFNVSGWILIKNTENHIIYTKPCNETEYYEICVIEQNKIKVSIPLKNSVYQYVNYFNTPKNVIEYIRNILQNE